MGFARGSTHPTRLVANHFNGLAEISGMWLRKNYRATFSLMASTQLKTLLERAETWPVEDQDELAEVARDIEARRRGVYKATPEELQAIDDADQSGVATDEEVLAAFRSFRRA